MATTVNPYLNFSGNCEEAFNFYKSVFGVEFSNIMRFKDMPPGTPGAHAGDDDLIVHVALPISKETILMGSDVPSSFAKVTQGNNFHISIQVDSDDEVRKLFNALSVGGKVTMPLDKMFWGQYFGMCTDKFGTQWMVGHNSDQQS